MKLPTVLVAPIRADVVHFVHTNMRKNSRQAYSVNVGAGHQHSAESWGTGRAVSRIPRVSGSGTHRAGQAAFGNMCRKGRMFAPTKTWRKWHRKVNVNQRRYATVSALAASALPALVLARGHRVMEVEELPLVVSNDVEKLTKTSKAVDLLKAVGAYADVEKAKASRQVRTGRGKLRGRRHTMRRGPLIVYNEDNGIVRAFRNIPGVDLAQVDRLNLLQLAPGGHVGRFIIWSQAAFEKLDSVFGTFDSASEQKSNYKLPRPMVINGDIARIIRSDEVQSAIRPARECSTKFVLKKNPLKNLSAMIKLNPYASKLRTQERKQLEAKSAAKRKAVSDEQKGKNKKIRAAQKKFYNDVLVGGTNIDPSATEYIIGLSWQTISFVFFNTMVSTFYG